MAPTWPTGRRCRGLGGSFAGFHPTVKGNRRWVKSDLQGFFGGFFDGVYIVVWIVFNMVLMVFSGLDSDFNMVSVLVFLLAK